MYFFYIYSRKAYRNQKQCYYLQVTFSSYIVDKKSKDNVLCRRRGGEQREARRERGGCEGHKVRAGY
jgi:hypothetical protein